MSKKIIWILVVVIVIISLIVSNNNKDIAIQDGDKVTVKIGATLPLTGDVAVLGQNSRKAIELALEDLGETKYNYEIVFEDDQFKTSTGVSTANKLISIDKVSAILSFGSPVGNVISPIAEAQEVPHINFFASDMNVANGLYNFVNYTPPYNDAKLFVSELQRREIKKLVIFEVQDNPGAAAITKALEEEIEGTDIEIIANPKFNSDTQDFRTLIAEVKDKDADIYLLQTSSPSLETLYKQIREMGIETPVTSIETFEFSNDISLFEGSWYVNAADPEEWFVDKYTNKFEDSPKFGAANGYDSLQIIVRAIEKIGNGKEIPSRKDIRDAIQNTKRFDGALGKDLKFDDDGIVDSDAVVREIIEGSPVTIK
jgi:branched-chain amino acid transport system substrate-binding protein